MITFLFVLAGLSSTAGALLFMVTLTGSNSAPQEAAGAAMAVALAVIPYVFARCLQITSERTEANRRHEEVISALKSQSAPSVDVPHVNPTVWVR